MLERKRLFGLTPVALAVMLAVTGCGGNAKVTDDSSDGGGGDMGGTPTDTGGGTTTPPVVETQSISGGGIKGPMAHAIVTVYVVDTAQPGFKGEQVAAATTNAQAAIEGLAIPKPFTPPYIIEFTSDSTTIDITTGETPVITTLRSIITQEMLDEGAPIYATPLTNMAVDLAIKNSEDNVGGSSVGASSTEDFLAKILEAAQQVASTLGFGIDEDVDIFETPPLIDESTDTQEEQSKVVAYRGAVEALTAIVTTMREEASRVSGDQDLDTGDMMGALVDDLSDGEIDGQGSEGAIVALVDEALDILDVDPANLPIPGVVDDDGNPVTVGDIKEVLISEKETTGSTTSTEDFENIQTRIQVAQKNPDRDGDTHLNVRDAFPDDPTEWRDTDVDGVGNNADTDDDNDGVPDDLDDFPENPFESKDTDGDGLGNNADSDDDNDGVPDSDDDYPLDAERSSKTDQDNDGWPAHLDADDNDVQVPGISWQDTDNDGLPDDNEGGISDDDDDNDGVPDDLDAFPKDAKEQVDTDGDTIGNNADTDDDGDGVEDDKDAFPLDATESSDHDRDGKGDNADTDDDNDGLTDAEEEELGSNPLKRDTDGDGRLDGKDEFPANAEEWKDLDKDGTGDNADTDDDNDGLTDEEEKEWGSNPYEADTDGDGTNDGQDAFPRDDKEQTDTDKDGVGDKADAFPEDATEFGDKDGDGVGDNADAFPENPEESKDTDKDGIGDIADNCALTPNKDQLDANGNGIGDACEAAADTADLSGVWKYTLTEVSTTCPADEHDEGPDGPESGYISIVQEGAVLDMLPVDAGFNIEGLVDGSSFSFETTRSGEDPFSGEVRTETVSGVDGEFTDSDEGPDTFSVTLNIGEGDCSTTNSLSGERVYQHSGTEDYSNIYKVEMSFEEESQMADGTGHFHHDSHRTQEAFPIEIVQTGTQLDLFSGEGKFTTTSIDPESGRFEVQFTESDINEFGGTETEDFMLKGVFIAAPDASGPILVFSETSFETETDGYDEGEPTVGPSAVGEVIRMSQERGFAYAKPTDTASFTTLVKSPTGEAVYIGLANPPMAFQGEEGQLRMDVLSATGETVCSNHYLGGFKEITKLDHPEEFGQFRTGAYASIVCDASQGGQQDVISGSAYTVNVVDSTGTPVFSTEVVAAVTTAPTDLIPEVMLNGQVLPMPEEDTSVSGGSIPGFYNLNEPFMLEWTAPTDMDGFTGYQVRLHENDYHNYDDVTREVRRVTDMNMATFSPEDFDANEGVKFQVRATYEKSDGKTHGLTPKWSIASGINGTFDLAFDTGEVMMLEVYGQGWGIHHCFAFNEESQFECQGEGVDLDNGMSNIKLFESDGTERHFTLSFLSSTSGEIKEGDVVTGQFTLSDNMGTGPIPPGVEEPEEPGEAPNPPVPSLIFDGTDVTNMSLALEEGFHWFDSWSYDEYNPDGTSTLVQEAETGVTSYDPVLDEITFTDYEWDFDSSMWVEMTGSHMDVMLGSNGWELASVTESISFLDDMTINFQTTNSAGDVFEDMDVTAQEMDVSGFLIASVLDGGEEQSEAGEALFPAGSKLYKVSMTTNSDFYKLDCDDSGQCYYAMMQAFDGDGNYMGEDAITSLDALLATSADDAMSKAQHLGHDGDASLRLVLFGDLSQGQGTASIYKDSHDGTTPTEERNDLAWEKRTVNGVDLILVNVPEDYFVEDLDNPAIIFSVYNGNVVRGEYTPAGVTREEGARDFNATGINAVLNAIGMPME